MCGNGPISRVEFSDLLQRIDTIEHRVTSYLLKHREAILRDLSEIETLLRLPRTKARYNNLADIDEQISYLEKRRLEIVQGIAVPKQDRAKNLERA